MLTIQTFKFPLTQSWMKFKGHPFQSECKLLSFYCFQNSNKYVEHIHVYMYVNTCSTCISMHKHVNNLYALVYLDKFSVFINLKFYYYFTFKTVPLLAVKFQINSIMRSVWALFNCEIFTGLNVLNIQFFQHFIIFSLFFSRTGKVTA